MQLYLALFFICLLAAIAPSFQENQIQQKRASRAAEVLAEKIPQSTKNMVHAMAASGMPHAAIADRIKQHTGGNAATAARVVDAIKSQAVRDKAAKSSAKSGGRKK